MRVGFWCDVLLVMRIITTVSLVLLLCLWYWSIGVGWVRVSVLRICSCILVCLFSFIRCSMLVVVWLLGCILMLISMVGVCFIGCIV